MLWEPKGSPPNRAAANSILSARHCQLGGLYLPEPGGTRAGAPGPRGLLRWLIGPPGAGPASALLIHAGGMRGREGNSRARVPLAPGGQHS